MTLKERFIEWAEKRDRRMREQDAVRRSHYRANRRYHNYFAGYTEYTQLQPNGKTKIVRVYTGAYFMAELTTPRYVLSRALYIVLWILAVVCQFSATMADLPYNYMWYVTVPEALGFPASFLVMMLVFSAAISERKLKIRQYKNTHQFIPLISLIGSGIHFLTGICMTLFIIINNISSVPGIWWPPLKMLAASVCFLVIGLIEKKISYKTLENPVKPIPGGVEIQ